MKWNKMWLLMSLVALLAIGMLMAASGCGDDDDDDDDDNDDSTEATGTVDFLTNGEEFIRDGFVGKTGWDITFTNFYVTLTGVTAYQEVVETSHAGHDHNDVPDGAAHVTLAGEHWVDLKLGTDAAILGSVEEAPVGNYNYLNFNMIQAADGDYSGYSIIMIGTATKDGETVDFTIKLNEEMTFYECHQEVDDEYAGVVDEDGIGTVEMTFHSDHLFGDYEDLGNDDGVNPGALGFQAFADLAEDGVLNIDQDEMLEQLATADYVLFLDALKTLGHSGEGHCEYREYSE